MVSLRKLLFFTTQIASSKRRIISNDIKVSFSPSTKTIRQAEFLNYLEDTTTKACFALGPAGTGKTYLSCQYAIKELLDNKKKQILVTKPFVTVSDEAIGFLPGGIQSKMEPWMKNFIHCMQTNNAVIDHIVRGYLDTKRIDFTPMGFMRGTTIEDTILIADEMQNSSPSQMKMLLTRLGKNSQMIITGDVNQKDTTKTSGLEDFLNRYYKSQRTKSEYESAIKVIEFQVEDIQREDFVKYVLQIYEHDPTKQRTMTDTLTLYNDIIRGRGDNPNDGFNDSAMIPKSSFR